MPSALFLSPHYDDVALSCGGTVAPLADRGTDTTVVTIFGGEVIDDVRGSVVGIATRLVPEQGPVERFWPVLPRMISQC